MTCLDVESSRYDKFRHWGKGPLSTPQMWAAVAVLLIASAAIASVVQLLKARALAAKLNSGRRMLQDLASAADKKLGFGEALVQIMDIVARNVEADGYYFYVREERENTLVLRAVKSTQIDPKVGLSYSEAVASPSEDEYKPPLGLLPDSQPKQVSVVREQGETLLCIPLWSDDKLEGAIHVGPVATRKVAPGQIQALSELASLCANMVALLAERDRLRRQVDESSAISSVSATMMRSTFQGEAAMGLFLRLGSGLVGADGGMVVVVDETGEAPWTPAYWGVPEDARERMMRELAWPAELFAPTMDPLVLTTGTGETSSTPGWLAEMGINSLWVIPFAAERRPGAVIYWFKSPRKPEGYVRSMLEIISDRVASTIRNINVYEEMLQSYLGTLTSIVDLLDSQEPSTANHSMLISKYSRDIALAMELSPEEVEAVSLAAYLHDVGMIGMGEDVLFKRGQLTASEYESVKCHAQLGATLAEPVTRPLPIAPLVRHHHERYDGWGYPSGLKGEQIPLGARIIAVADFFNAKVSSRNYRKALPYEKAITDLQAASGSQLDPGVVDAFVRLWEKRQKSAERKGKPLEDCWVMMQCPSRIATMCPAYKSARNCWEVPGVQCSMHGDECETCLVYTEYRFRQRKPQLRVIAGGRTQE